MFYVLGRDNFSLQLDAMHPFGGLQVIVVGDFYQLPPVPNWYCSDPGDWAFNSQVWRQADFVYEKLTEFRRQDDAVFTQ